MEIHMQRVINKCDFCGTTQAKRYHVCNKGLLCSKHYAQNRKGRLGVAREYNLHGKSKTPEYSVWKGVIRRCTNTNRKQAKDYVLRGITVCKQWQGKYGFDNFLEDMGERPSNKHSIERRDNDKGYYPDNCYWATFIEQNNNRRDRCDNTSGYTGVSWDSTGEKWVARITINSKRINLGRFLKKEDAINARLESEKQIN